LTVAPNVPTGLGRYPWIPGLTSGSAVNEASPGSVFKRTSRRSRFRRALLCSLQPIGFWSTK